MGVKHFQELNVWQKSHQLTLDIYQVTQAFPALERYGLTSQIRRSPSSVCANIAEGSVKKIRDFIRYLEISRGSLEETKYHLILSRDLKYIELHQYHTLFKASDDIGAMLFGLIRKLTNK